MTAAASLFGCDEPSTGGNGGGTGTGGTGGTSSGSGGTCPDSSAGFFPVVQCVFPLPIPPAGERLDLGTFNVLYTNIANSPPRELQYNSDCNSLGDETGWTFSGNTIQLCTVTCSQLEADPTSQLIVEACAVPGGTD